MPADGVDALTGALIAEPGDAAEPDSEPPVVVGTVPAVAPLVAGKVITPADESLPPSSPEPDPQADASTVAETDPNAVLLPCEPLPAGGCHPVEA